MAICGTIAVVCVWYGPSCGWCTSTTASPPSFDERQRLIEIARFCERNLSALSMVATANNHLVAEQLLRGMSFLVRATFMLYGAKNDWDGASWLVKQGYTFDADPKVSIAVLLDALQQTRALRSRPADG